MDLISLIFEVSGPESQSDLSLYNDYLPLISILSPCKHLSRSNSSVSNVASKSGDFRVNLDVQQFKPDEISAKIEKNFVVIEAKQEEKQDQQGFISRRFVRRYLLPDNVDKEKVECKLNLLDGILVITAPKLIKSQNIPIQQTNQPAMCSEQLIF
ncbi:alpha-crystallin A chain-like [Cloeon dipterum]|uniref:alpha-crystallin A chain-like n=1 Tax=Cloeon dipterum TaxID=197152 RepID=UPI00321FD114